MHNDFGNNTVLFPARNAKHWGQPEEVQSILYYNDFDGESSNYGGGGTAFVPGLGHTLDGRLDSSKDPPERNGLYSVERQAAYTKGSVFLYSLGTWHRGTPVEPHGIRRIQFNCYRTKAATWVGGDNSGAFNLNVVCNQVLGQPQTNAARALDSGVTVCQVSRNFGRDRRTVYERLPGRPCP
jgi:hypothetical protein